jgi:hypothetical protein
MHKVLRLLAMVGLIFLTSILGAILLALGTGAARAAIIGATPTSVQGPGGTGSGVVVTTAGLNAIVLDETFTSIGAIDAAFQVSSSGGTTEYVAAVFTTNSTGVSWTDFHFQLIPTTGSDNLDFATNLVPVSNSFTSLFRSEDTLDWSGGTVPSGGGGGTPVNVFAIDVPALSGGTFTLRAVPTVPEPSTAITVGLGLLGLFGYGRLRRLGKRSRD